MVRINLVNPRHLADQHLVAEYNEMLMLVGYVRRHPLCNGIPPRYTLGTGHIRFFKDKLGYIHQRFIRVKREMELRGFQPKKELDLTLFAEGNKNIWRPRARDYVIIRQRLLQKIQANPGLYRYYGVHRSPQFFLNLLSRKKNARA
jgi:deoxyribonuclease (pyrimidine dimer)